MYLDLLATCLQQTTLTVSGRSFRRVDRANDVAVDICITTEWKEMEGVCMVAELLAKSEPYQSFPDLN